MPQSERVRSRRQALDKRLARLRVEKNRLIARVNQTEHKRDTRRKILIGGAVLAAIGHDGVPAIRSTPELLSWLDAQLTRERDRDVFGLPSRREITPEPAIRPCKPSVRSGAAVKDADQGEAPPSGAQRP